MSDCPNPPAFPLSPGDVPYYQEGMTLRDWFAGQALPAVIAATSAGQHHPGNGFNDERNVRERMVEDAYHLADVMLAERAKQKSFPQAIAKSVCMV